MKNTMLYRHGIMSTIFLLRSSQTLGELSFSGTISASRWLAGFIFPAIFLSCSCQLAFSSTLLELGTEDMG